MTSGDSDSDNNNTGDDVNQAQQGTNVQGDNTTININSTIVQGAATAEVKLPRTYEQSILTTVSVASGQTVVLGGLLEHKKNVNIKKVPLLGDIPFLGWLFQHKEVTYTPMNLLVFVTATVINDQGQFVERK